MLLSGEERRVCVSAKLILSLRRVDLYFEEDNEVTPFQDDVHSTFAVPHGMDFGECAGRRNQVETGFGTPVDLTPQALQEAISSPVRLKRMKEPSQHRCRANFVPAQTRHSPWICESARSPCVGQNGMEVAKRLKDALWVQTVAHRWSLERRAGAFQEGADPGRQALPGGNTGLNAHIFSPSGGRPCRGGDVWRTPA